MREKKTKVIHIRVTKAEYQLCHTIAEAENTSIGQILMRSFLEKYLSVVEDNTSFKKLLRVAYKLREIMSLRQSNTSQAHDLHLFSNATGTIYRLLLKNGYLTGKINYKIASDFVDRVNAVYNLFTPIQQEALKSEFKEFQNFKEKPYLENFMTKSGSFNIILKNTEGEKHDVKKLSNGRNIRKKR